MASGTLPPNGRAGPRYAAAVGTVLAGRLALQSAWAVAARPRLWPTAVAQMVRFAPDRWWRRPPFVPLPGPDLVRFRSEAMYGDPAQAPSPPM